MDLIECITVAATVVIAVSTAVNAWSTSHLARENRRLRKLGKDPTVVAYLFADPETPFDIAFVVANIGSGPARNIMFSLDLDYTCFPPNAAIFMRNTSDQGPIGFLLQDEKWTSFFGSSGTLLKTPRHPPFNVKVEWENMDGAAFHGQYTLDVSAFAALIPPRQRLATQTPTANKTV